ncbi:MAG: hypothetical protein J6S54_01790, partial [Lentisphaeria bacterium]|nr:hypothetical protein [Lentisphaeria bacterium]
MTKKRYLTIRPPLVRQPVEKAINSLPDAEADAICDVKCHQRTPDLLDTRAEVISDHKGRPCISVHFENSKMKALFPSRVGKIIFLQKTFTDRFLFLK